MYLGSYTAGMDYGPAVILRFKGQTSNVGRQNQGLRPFPSRTVCGFFNVPQNYLQISVVTRSLRKGSGVPLKVGGGEGKGSVLVWIMEL